MRPPPGAICEYYDLNRLENPEAIGPLVAGLVRLRVRQCTASRKESRIINENHPRPSRVVFFPTDRERFELSIPLQVCRFSRPVHSTALPPVQQLSKSIACNNLDSLAALSKSTSSGFSVPLSVPLLKRPYFPMRGP